MIAPLVLLGSKLRDRQTYKAVFIIWTHFEDVSAQLLSRVWLFVTPGTRQAPLSISQTRILEWVSVSYSRGSSWPRDWGCLSYVSCIGEFFTTAHLGSPNVVDQPLLKLPGKLKHKSNKTISSHNKYLRETHAHKRCKIWQQKHKT